MERTIVYIWAVILILIQIDCVRPSSPVTNKWLNALQLDSDYDTTLPPSWVKSQTPTVVDVDFFVETLGSFESLSMDYEIDIYFIERWHDYRLQHNFSYPIQFSDRRLIDMVWVPDIFIANSKKARYNVVTVPNHIFTVAKDGSVRFSIRIAAKVSCHMNLRSFPMDKQECFLKFLTYGNNASRVQLRWNRNAQPIRVNADLLEADLHLYNTSATCCNGTYLEGNYSCLMGRFFLRRALGQNLLQVYVPTFSIVCISWISFWIDPTSVPGRVGLAVTTLLTLATQAAGVAFSLPPVGYAKALDIWLSVCLLFLFGSLIEFTLVNMFTRRWQNRVSKPDNGLVGLPLLASMAGSDMDAASRIQQGWYYQRMAKRIDKVSRWIFPTLFAIFAIVYWSYYLLIPVPKQAKGIQSCRYT